MLKIMEKLIEKVQTLERVEKQTLEYLPKEINENLYKLLGRKDPLVLDEFEGKIFMRGECGSKPCKGYYQ